MPKAKALKNYKIVDEVKIFWRLVAVGNGSKIPHFDFFSAFDEGMSICLGETFVTLWVLVGIINSWQSGCVGWVWELLIVWGGEWGKWGGFGVIIRVKYGLHIVVGRVCRSYQQIVNNLWKMV